MHGRVFIADTYNHKIKLLDPTRRSPRSRERHAGLPTARRSRFHEPGGLSIAERTLYVADTNNHAIRTVDLSSATRRHAAIDGLTPPEAWSYLRRR